MLSSKAERKIHELLTFGNMPFEEEYIFQDLKAENGKPLRFDFCVFDDDEEEIKCLIEFNGRQHYVPIPKFGGKKGLAQQKHNDAAKRRYCLQNGYRLITIPYTEEDNLDFDYLMRLIEGY